MDDRELHHEILGLLQAWDVARYLGTECPALARLVVDRAPAGPLSEEEIDAVQDHLERACERLRQRRGRLEQSALSYELVGWLGPVLMGLVEDASLEPASERIKLAADTAAHHEHLGQYTGASERNLVRRGVQDKIASAIVLELLRPAGHSDHKTKHRDMSDPESSLGLYVEAIEVVRRFRGVSEQHETRRVRASSSGVDRYPIPIFLDEEPEAAVETEIVYGGRLIDDLLPHDGGHAPFIEFPAPLALGDSHQFAVVRRFATNYNMKRPPGICFEPLHPIGLCTVRLQFDLQRLPIAVWRFDHVDLDLALRSREGLEPAELDRFGYIEATFAEPDIGWAHGLTWSWGLHAS